MPIDSRTGTFTDKSPNIEALGFDWPELAKLNEEASRLGRELVESNAKLRELSDSRQQADKADRAAYAAAIREGNPKPTKTAVSKVEAEIEAVRERQQALKVAISEAERDRTTAIAEHRDAWRTEVEERIPQVASRLEAAVAEAMAARAELAALRGVYTWLEEPGKPFSAPDGSTTYILHARTQRRGDDPTLAQLRAEAREVAGVH